MRISRVNSAPAFFPAGNCHHSYICGHSGMTLVEVMVAAVIMVMAMSGILYSFVQCLELQALGRDVSLVSQNLAVQLEQIKRKSYAGVTRKTDFSTLGVDQDALFTDLIERGYIDTDGVITRTFLALDPSVSSRDIVLDTAFLAVKTRVYSIIKQTHEQSFNRIIDNNNMTFTIDGLNGIGLVTVTANELELLTIKLEYSWRTTYGRVVGEDTNLNGALNAGEDVNGNGELDSYAQIVTQISG